MSHRYLSLVASSALALSMAVAPTISLAASSQAFQGGQTQTHITTTGSLKGSDRGAKEENSDNGFFDNFASYFGARVAFADSGTTTSHTPVRLMPPVISGVSSPTVLAVGATGTWSVSASDPQNSSLSYAVDWADQGVHPLFASASQQIFVQTASFTHAYAAPGTYTVKFTVKDNAGLTSTSTVTVHVTGPQVQPLVISAVAATSSSPTHAAINWNTNLRSNSSVFYSTSTPVDTSTALSASASARVLNHRINLTKLSAGTTYYFVVQSTDAEGAVAMSPESSFTTPVLPSHAPSIQSIDGPQTIAAETQGTWTVNASDPENSTLSYSIDWGDTPMMHAMALMAPQQVFTQTSTFTHTYANPGTYTITVTVTDSAGLTATQTTSVVVTAAPVEPVLTNVAVGSVSATGATLTWNTDENADSEVWIGTTSPDTSLPATQSDATAVMNHSVTVSGLTANTAYVVVVGSLDADGNFATSSAISFTTSSAVIPPVEPVITDVAAGSITTTAANITWNTDEAASSELWIGTSTPNTSLTPSVINSATTTSHSLPVTNLATSTTYFVIVGSRDASGNMATSSAVSFTTAPAVMTPTLSGITAMVSNNSILFNWNTNENADSEVYYSTTSPVTIGGAGTTPVTDATLVSNHSLSVSDLSAGTTYYFIIQSTDGNGATTKTPQFTLTTMDM